MTATDKKYVLPLLPINVTSRDHMANYTYFTLKIGEFFLNL